MLKTASVALAATVLGLAGTSAASAAPTKPLRFDGIPSVRYTTANGGTIGVVVRLNQKLTNTSRAGFFAAPSLRRGEKVARSYGGNPPASIGRTSRHCYVAEAARPEPRAALRNQARWELGVSTAGKQIIDTSRITLKRQSDEGWERAMARRLGCYSSATNNRSSSADDDLAGKRIRVDADQLLIYADPNKSFIGSLQKGESFKIRRLSPSGKYAYGFAYGDANKLGWVLTRGLRGQ